MGQPPRPPLDVDVRREQPLGEPVNFSGARRPARGELVGSDVTLRPLDPAGDAERLFSISHPPEGDPRIWTYLPDGPFEGVDAYRDFLDVASRSDDPLFFSVVVDGCPQGVVSYLAIVPEHGTIEIGNIWFGPALARTRAATEAIYLLARHAFDDLGYRRLEWKCNALNAPSRRAAERFGFAFEGTFHAHRVAKGHNRDTAWFAMTAERWPLLRDGFEAWLDPENFDSSGTQTRPLARVGAAREPWECAYGENAWQAPARLVHAGEDPLAIGALTQLEGAPVSYNNLAEFDRQLQTITHIAAAFDVAGGPIPAIAIGTKHGNCCGAGVAETPLAATRRMLTGDTRAIFGGCVMLGFAVDAEIADALLSHASDGRRLLDTVVASAFSDAAVELLARKQGRCRILANPALAGLGFASLDTAPRQRPVRGGVLEQPNYAFVLDLEDPDLWSHGDLSEAQSNDLLLAWAVGSTSNSNTVTVVRDGQLLGNGVGQQDRVGGCALAIARGRDAGHDLNAAVAYSDSFFPFPDGPQTLIDAGVSAIFSTSGSVRDDVVRQTMIDAGVAVRQLPDRQARGFFGH